jgi:hypothetical protein
LAVNLVWPRKGSIKACCILLLLLTAYLHGFSGLNPLDRAVGLSERILTGQQAGTPEQVVSNLHFGQALAHATMFDVSLGLTLGVIFAATPVDIFMRRRSRLLRQRHPHEAVQITSTYDAKN